MPTEISSHGFNIYKMSDEERDEIYAHYDGYGIISRALMAMQPGDKWNVPSRIRFNSVRATCFYLSKKHGRKYVPRQRKKEGDRSVARLW